MLIAGCALFVWHAVALSRLFPRLGGEGWKGWVPVLNEAEILTRGGVPGWAVVFFFIPLVQFYGLYLKVVAVHRLNVRFRHGKGLTVLGILLPPLWATLLARAGDDPMPEAAEKPRVDAVRALPDPGRSTKARDASGYAIPIPAPLEAALIDDVPIEREPAPAEPFPDPAVPEEAPALLTAAPVAEAPPTAAPTPPTPAAASPSWQLMLDDGTALVLTSSQVVLGRRPASGQPEQLLSVPDTTRTLSKTHARLEYDGSSWYLTDLNSTNGSRVASASGWTTLTPGIRVPLAGPFQLGDVGAQVIVG